MAVRSDLFAPQYKSCLQASLQEGIAQHGTFFSLACHDRTRFSRPACLL